MGNTIDLTTLLMNASRECRLVLNEEQTKILGRGETIKEGAEEAKINGVDDPIVIWSSKTWTARAYREVE